MPPTWNHLCCSSIFNPELNPWDDVTPNLLVPWYTGKLALAKLNFILQTSLADLYNFTKVQLKNPEGGIKAGFGENSLNRDCIHLQLHIWGPTSLKFKKVYSLSKWTKVRDFKLKVHLKVIDPVIHHWGSYFKSRAKVVQPSDLTMPSHLFGAESWPDGVIV